MVFVAGSSFWAVVGRCGLFHVLVITANSDIIRQDELEEIDTDSVGSDVFGNCFLRKLKRLGINVVEATG